MQTFECRVDGGSWKTFRAVDEEDAASDAAGQWDAELGDYGLCRHSDNTVRVEVRRFGAAEITTWNARCEMQPQYFADPEEES